MLNTADDPIDFLKREAAYAGACAIDGMLLLCDVFVQEFYIVRNARRAWRFALAAKTLEDARHRDALEDWREHAADTLRGSRRGIPK